MLCAISQSSVLPPLLYSLYKHDLPTLPQTNMTLYADNVAIQTTSLHSHTAVAKVLYRAALDHHKIKINSYMTDFIKFIRKVTNTYTVRHVQVQNKNIRSGIRIRYVGVDVQFRPEALLGSTVTLAVFYKSRGVPCCRSPAEQTDQTYFLNFLINQTMSNGAPIWSGPAKNYILKFQSLQNTSRVTQ